MVNKRREKGTGNVRKDPNRPGSWIGAITIGGRRYTARGRTKADVSYKLSRKRGEVLSGAPGATDDRTVTVAAVVDRFIERELPTRKSNGRPLAPGTVNNYRTYLAAVREELGSVKLANLTVASVETMLDRLAARGYSSASLTKLRSMFATVVDSAVRRDQVHRNVVRLATIPPTAKRARTRRSLNPEDARKLLGALREPYIDPEGNERTERNGAMWALSLRLGLRPGEAAALHWDDLDLEAGTVNVTRGLQRNGGKVSVVDDLKTTASKRTIEMPGDLVAWLIDHRREQRKERMAATSWADDRLVFASPRGAPIDPSNGRDDLTAICKRAGVPRTLPVELRHSCASLLSDEGVPNELIADLLGHTTTRMVDATYRHRLRPVVDVATRATWATTTAP